MKINVMKNLSFELFICLALLLIGSAVKAQTITPATEFPYIKVHPIDGVGWSTPIGTSLKSGNVYWTYIDPQLNGVVAMKTPDGVITSQVVITNIQNNDNHAEMSLGIDNDGYIHVLGGHHNSSPKYYVSRYPEDIRTWDFRGNDTTIGGIEGKGITYQGFYRSNNGTLFVAMRSNLLNNFQTGVRSIALGRYNTQTKKWKMLGGKNYTIPGCVPVTGEQNGMTAFVWNPSGVGDMTGCGSMAHYQGYQLRILFDKNNGMHVTYNMADSININYATSDVSKFMTHLFYAFSPDEGDTWFKANGQQITSFPITKANGDLVYKKIPTGYKYPALTDTYTMQNANDLLLDLDGKPIIMQGVYVPNETKVFKWNGSKWIEITYDISFYGDKVYTGLYRGETYNFGSNGTFFISTDNQNSWTEFPSTIETNNNLMIDKYYLQKTGKLRYYSRRDNVTAGIITLSIKGNEINKTVYSVKASAADTNGTVIPATETFCSGLTASVYAKPDAGYILDSWSGDVVGNANPLLLVMNANKTVSANFIRDITIPSTPGNLQATQISTANFLLSWDASTDNNTIAYYTIYKDGDSIAFTSDTSYLIDKLLDNTFYSFSVSVRDNAGNISLSSELILLQTLKTPFASNETIAMESFSYDDGTLNPDPDNGANSGFGYPASNYQYKSTGFRNNWGTNAKVVPGSLVYLDKSDNLLLSSGNALLIENAYGTISPALYQKVENDPFGAFRISTDNDLGANNSTIWFSFLMKVPDVTKKARLIFKSSANTPLFYAGLTANKWCLTTVSNSIPVDGIAATENTTTFLLGKITYGSVGTTALDDSVELWVNPDLSGELSLPASTLSNINASFSQFQTHTDITIAQPQSITFDEFRIGLTREAVTPYSNTTSSKNRNTFSRDEIRVYPNPAKDNIRIYGIRPNSILTIVSIEGKVVMQKRGIISGNDILSVKNLSNGVYLVRVTDQSGTFVSKLIINRE